MGPFLKKSKSYNRYFSSSFTRCAFYIEHYIVWNRLHEVGLSYLALTLFNLDLPLALMTLRSLHIRHPMILFFFFFMLMIWLLLVIINKAYFTSNIILVNILIWKTLDFSTTFLALKSLSTLRRVFVVSSKKCLWSFSPLQNHRLQHNFDTVRSQCPSDPFWWCFSWRCEFVSATCWHSHLSNSD